MIEGMGNPFTDESKDLLVLDIRDIVDLSVVDAMYNLKEKGQEQYNIFVTEQLISQQHLEMILFAETNFLFSVVHNYGRSPE